MSDNQPLIETKQEAGAFNNRVDYKAKVKQAKAVLKKQIIVLVLLSFLFSLGMFLSFFWVVGWSTQQL